MASQNMKSANATYDSFIAAVKWAVPVLALITLAVVIIIAE